jgi:hypothetical protein
MVTFLTGIEKEFVSILGTFVPDMGHFSLRRRKRKMKALKINYDKSWRPKKKGGTGMPLYEYLCFTCGAKDQRIAGLDDHIASCVECGGIMARTQDPFESKEEEGPQHLRKEM